MGPATRAGDGRGRPLLVEEHRRLADGPLPGRHLGELGGGRAAADRSGDPAHGPPARRGYRRRQRVDVTRCDDRPLTAGPIRPSPARRGLRGRRGAVGSRTSAAGAARSRSPSCRRRAGSFARRTSTRDAASTSPGGNSRAGSPTVSGWAPPSAATTGTPWAMASTTESPKGSSGAVARTTDDSLSSLSVSAALAHEVDTFGHTEPIGQIGHRTAPVAGAGHDEAPSGRSRVPLAAQIRSPSSGLFLLGQPVEHQDHRRLQVGLGPVGHGVVEQHGGPGEAAGHELADGDVTGDRAGHHLGQRAGHGAGAPVSGEVAGGHDRGPLERPGQPGRGLGRRHVDVDDVDVAPSGQRPGGADDGGGRPVVDPACISSARMRSGSPPMTVRRCPRRVEAVGHLAHVPLHSGEGIAAHDLDHREVPPRHRGGAGGWARILVRCAVPLDVHRVPLSTASGRPPAGRAPVPDGGRPGRGMGPEPCPGLRSASPIMPEWS